MNSKSYKARDVKPGWRVNFGTLNNPRVYVVHAVVKCWANLVQIRSARSVHCLSVRPDTLVPVVKARRAKCWR